jgi:hypothetical protein
MIVTNLIGRPVAPSRYAGRGHHIASTPPVLDCFEKLQLVAASGLSDIALGRKSWLFCTSDRGGLTGRLADVLARPAMHLGHRWTSCGPASYSGTSSAYSPSCCDIATVRVKLWPASSSETL